MHDVVLHDLRERLVYGDGEEPLASPARHSRPRGARGVAPPAARAAAASPAAARPASPPPARPVARPAPLRAQPRLKLAAPLLAALALLGALLAACWFAPPLDWPARSDGVAAAAPAADAAELAALRRRVAALEARVAALPAEACAPPPPPPPAAAAEAAPSPSPAAVAAEVASALDRFWADRTGRPDYAAAAAGGRVLAHSPLVTWSDAAPAPLHPRADELLLSAALEAPGHCLPLNASAGAWVDVALREAIIVTAVSLEHVHRGIAFDSRSAPRRFALTALREGGGEGGVLVAGSYDVGGAAVQTFAAQAGPPAPVSRVRLALRSNHGADYTCIYRLRVHGRPAAEAATRDAAAAQQRTH